MRHATEPDHLIAITTIVSRQNSLRGAAWIGALWGIGHSLTVAFVGGAILLFTVVIPPRLGLAMEFSVGVMLVILGLANIRGFSRWLKEQSAEGLAQPHSHMHAHGDYSHQHRHGHRVGEHGHREEQTPQAWLDRHIGSLGLYQFCRPVVVGVVHGLAGSTAVALIVLTAIDSPLWGAIYLALFGLGTITGMTMITFAIAMPFAYSARRYPRFSTWLRMGSGLVSLCLGLFLMVYFGLYGGLFTDHPIWTPR